MRAIRITQTNWLNDEVGGDQNTVKMVRDEMATEAVEVWHIAEYAPEWDQSPQRAVPQPQPVPEATEVLTIPVTKREDGFEFPEQPQVVDIPPEAPQPAEEEAPPLDLERPQRRPYANESKAAWIEWALAGEHDGPPITAEDAAAMTKNELMAAYGERL